VNCVVVGQHVLCMVCLLVEVWQRVLCMENLLCGGVAACYRYGFLTVCWCGTVLNLLFA